MALAKIAVWLLALPRIDTIPASRSLGISPSVAAVNSSATKTVDAG